jgi:solute carrier family 25 folate transporter 32
MVASVATYPHEVVRTRLQTQRRLLIPSGAPRKRSGIVRTTTKIIHFEGWRGLYKGLSVNLIRTVPNSAVTMLTCVHVFYYLSPTIVDRP